MKIVVIDFETGGLKPATASALTLGVVLVDMDAGEIIAEAYYRIADKPYECHPEALKVNGIDLVEHDATAMECGKVLDDLLLMLDNHDARDPEDNKFIAAGHNLQFDMGFLRRVATKAGTPNWPNEHLGHRSICTMTLIRSLQSYGKFPRGSSSLVNVCKTAGVDLSNAHNSLDDARATAELMMYLKDHVELKMDGGR